MSNVILICGKICCGKTTYAQALRAERGAVLLSIDELMLTMFGQHAGDKHDLYASRAKAFLLAKAVELIEGGVDVILDWGFWTKAGRDEAKAYFAARGIAYTFHYIDISDETWQLRLDKRNAAVLEGKTDAYYVDENLAAKFRSRFEAPGAEEIDVWVKA